MSNSRITNAGSEMKNFGASVTIDVGAAAVAFTAAQLPGPQKYVLLQVQAQPVRVSYGADTPTAAVGQRKVAGDEALFLRDTVLGMKFIREATDAKIWAQPCDLS